MGTIINTAAVVLGALLGLILNRRVNKALLDNIMKAVGVSVMFIGISGALTGMLKIQNGKIDSTGAMLLIISLVLGTLIGELIKIEDRLESIGEKLKKAVKSKSDGKFVDGFVTTTLITCVGAMAIVGALEDGLTGDYSMLLAKSLLDGIVAIILASTMGLGVLFSAIPLFIYQGAITLLSGVISPVLSDNLILNLSYIGSALIFSIGVNQVFGKKLKTGNMLPALLIPIIYEIIINVLK